MSDKEKVIKMLTQAGVKFTVVDDYVQVDVADQDEERREGYIGFISALYFNADGSLRTVGAWD